MRMMFYIGSLLDYLLAFFFKGTPYVVKPALSSGYYSLGCQNHILCPYYDYREWTLGICGIGSRTPPKQGLPDKRNIIQLLYTFSPPLLWSLNTCCSFIIMMCFLGDIYYDFINISFITEGTDSGWAPFILLSLKSPYVGPVFECHNKCLFGYLFY